MELEAQKPSRTEINRLNALKSVGPKTGKRKASLNALRHGLTGQTVVPPPRTSSDITASPRPSAKT